MENKGFKGTIRDMWEMHLRSRLLHILENYRIYHGQCLTREEWVEQAMHSVLVWLHHPILGTFHRNSFKRKIEKTIGSCIPSSDRFDFMTPQEKSGYYTTYNPAIDTNGNPVHSILEITQKGIAFTETLGYEQRLVERYGKGIYLYGLILGIVNLYIFKWWIGFIIAKIQSL